MTIKQTWECPKCGFVYKSPTKIQQMGHPCSKASRGLGPKKFQRMELKK